jgi:hypothetical protein
MSFHSNSPRKRANTATIGGTAYRGTRVSLSEFEPRQTRQED